MRIVDPRPRLLVAGDRLLAEPRPRLREQLGSDHALVDDLSPQPAQASVEAAAADQAREGKRRMEHALPVHAHQRPVVAQRQVRKTLVQIVVAGNDRAHHNPKLSMDAPLPAVKQRESGSIPVVACGPATE